ncbi:MAG: PadR family transcriptional regulator [Lachnospiraceae bacterium]|nr:PadR family transcriptional regulator [Lachnospiraceae bacterium]
MNGQMKKGILELIVLNEIEQSDVYGYELVKKLCEYYVDVDISAYYTILRRLHKKEYINCYEGVSSGGPKRKYYFITDQGRDYLQERKLELQYMNQMNQQLGLA